MYKDADNQVNDELSLISEGGGLVSVAERNNCLRRFSVSTGVVRPEFVGLSVGILLD